MTFLHRARYWLPLLPLLGILAATYWLDQQVQTATGQTDLIKRHEPDGMMVNFSAVTLSEQGTTSSIMHGKKLLHYPDDDSSTIEEPEITSMSTEQPASAHPPVHTTARFATVASKGDEVLLERNVRVVREASGKRGELVVSTELLQLFPDQNLIKTDRAITLVSDRDIVHAVGMEMDTRAHTVKLLSQVKAQHAAPQK